MVSWRGASCNIAHANKLLDGVGHEAAYEATQSWNTVDSLRWAWEAKKASTASATNDTSIGGHFTTGPLLAGWHLEKLQACRAATWVCSCKGPLRKWFHYNSHYNIKAINIWLWVVLCFLHTIYSHLPIYLSFYLVYACMGVCVYVERPISGPIGAIWLLRFWPKEWAGSGPRSSLAHFIVVSGILVHILFCWWSPTNFVKCSSLKIVSGFSPKNGFGQWSKRSIFENIDTL